MVENRDTTASGPVELLPTGHHGECATTARTWSPGAVSSGPSLYRIVLGRDTIVTLTQATALIPPRRRGRKASVSTLFRWSNSGCRGIILPTLQCGGTRCTSVEGLQWFFEALGQVGRGRGSQAGTAGILLRRSPAQRRRAAEAAGKRLEQRGA